MESCYGCYYEIENKCYWFVDNERTKYAKKIPGDIIMKGCSLRKSDVSIGDIAGNDLAMKVIEVFDGELLSDKFKQEIIETKKREWWKNKSKHKYTERKDW
jgi:hypothetical protein